MVIDSKSLLIYQQKTNAPVELNFDQKYGSIVEYCYYKKQELIIMAFTKGYIVSISIGLFNLLSPCKLWT
jgi:hypothetical protein